MPADGSLPTAVDTNTRSPHTIGLDTLTPATGVDHRMFCPVFTSHLIAVAAPSPTPDAFGPRNDGQFCADSVVVARRAAARAVDQARINHSFGLAPAFSRSATTSSSFACLAPISAFDRSSAGMPP